MTDDELDPRWAEAVTLGQLGELVAEWLEGRIQLDPVLPGTARLEDAATGSRSRPAQSVGFLTDQSQPGGIDGDWAQRAFVTGYCNDGAAERLASVSVRVDLVVLSQYPAGEERPSFEFPVTRDGNRTHTALFGHDYDWTGIPPEVCAVLQDAWYVSACDPVWGRNDLLWPALLDAMMRPIEDVRRLADRPARLHRHVSGLISSGFVVG
ncbi:MAG: DUF6919 domain-containing protein [Solirubrobacteraceae bacterium]